MSILDPLLNPQQTVANITQEVVDTGGSFLGNLIRSPFRMLSGAFHGALGSLWNGVKYTGIILGLRTLAPSLWNAGVKIVGGEAAMQDLRTQNVQNGLPGLIVDSAIKGFGTAAVLGGAGGAIEGAGGGLMGTVTTGIVMAAGAAVGLGAVHNSGTHVTGNAGNPPPPTPAGAPARTR